MSKVTSKLQVTLPKAIARHYGIRPGDEIHWVVAGDVIRVIPPTGRSSESEATDDRALRLRLFDQATERQRQRELTARKRKRVTDRGWRRGDLYDRGRAG